MGRQPPSPWHYLEKATGLSPTLDLRRSPGGHETFSNFSIIMLSYLEAAWDSVLQQCPVVLVVYLAWYMAPV